MYDGRQKYSYLYIEKQGHNRHHDCPDPKSGEKRNDRSRECHDDKQNILGEQYIDVPSPPVLHDYKVIFRPISYNSLRTLAFSATGMDLLAHTP